MFNQPCCNVFRHFFSDVLVQVSPKGQTFEPGERWMPCCKHAGNPLCISIETGPGKLSKTGTEIVYVYFSDHAAYSIIFRHCALHCTCFIMSRS